MSPVHCNFFLFYQENYPVNITRPDARHLKLSFSICWARIPESLLVCMGLFASDWYILLQMEEQCSLVLHCIRGLGLDFSSHLSSQLNTLVQNTTATTKYRIQSDTGSSKGGTWSMYQSEQGMSYSGEINGLFTKAWIELREINRR